MCNALIVDPSPIGRMLANDVLVTLDYAVREARDCASAVHICKLRMPDLVVVDWDAPDALDTIGAVRALPSGQHPTVLVYASEDEPGQILLAVIGGADEYLAKPLRREEIEDRLAQLASFALNQELAA
jgi:two-component system chemotaxis response regulator CheY